MKYALLFYDKPDTFAHMSQAELEETMGGYAALTERADFVAGAQL